MQRGRRHPALRDVGRAGGLGGQLRPDRCGRSRSRGLPVRRLRDLQTARGDGLGARGPPRCGPRGPLPLARRAGRRGAGGRRLPAHRVRRRRPAAAVQRLRARSRAVLLRASLPGRGRAPSVRGGRPAARGRPPARGPRLARVRPGRPDGRLRAPRNRDGARGAGTRDRRGTVRRTRPAVRRTPGPRDPGPLLPRSRVLPGRRAGAGRDGVARSRRAGAGICRAGRSTSPSRPRTTASPPPSAGSIGRPSRAAPT